MWAILLYMLMRRTSQTSSNQAYFLSHLTLFSASFHALSTSQVKKWDAESRFYLIGLLVSSRTYTNNIQCEQTPEEEVGIPFEYTLAN
jgi:hypothetical protein